MDPESEHNAMPCGCEDYHWADCPIVAPPSEPEPEDYWEGE